MSVAAPHWKVTEVEVIVYPTLHWYVSVSILPRRPTRFAFNSRFQGVGRKAGSKK